MHCLSCNEELLPEATLCRFCGRYVTQPEPMTRADIGETQKPLQLMTSSNARDTPRLDIPILTKFSVIIFVLFGLFVIYQLLAYSEQPEHNGDPIDLRGTNIITLRMPDTIAPSQRVAIYEEGTVLRYFTPYDVAISQKTQAVLSLTEQRDLQTFRAQWCATNMQFTQPKIGHPVYDIAVRCDAPHIKQGLIPAEQLPVILRDILQRVPPLSH